MSLNKRMAQGVEEESNIHQRTKAPRVYYNKYVATYTYDIKVTYYSKNRMPSGSMHAIAYPDEVMAWFEAPILRFALENCLDKH